MSNTGLQNVKVTSSLEDYLEVILQLDEIGGKIRSVDIADRLNVGKPSVTAALKTLAEKKLVNYLPYKSTTLTDDGRKIAKSVREKHIGLRIFLVEVLGMESGKAEVEACRLEHAVSDELLNRLNDLGDGVVNGPPAVGEWFNAFRKNADRHVVQKEQCHE